MNEAINEVIAVLEFYADSEVYRDKRIEVGPDMFRMTKPVILDRGEKARQALERIREVLSND